MNGQSNLFWQRWLLVVTVGVVLFGLAFMLLPDLMQQVFNLLLFGAADADGRFDATTVDYLEFVYGVLGAVMIGWGASLLLIVMGPFRRGEREGWNMLAVSLGVWYVVDSAFSVYSGFAANAALNTVFFVLYLIPLAATYRQFHAQLQAEAIRQ